MLPDDHELYIEVDCTLKNITVSNLIIKIQSYGLCNGIVTPDPSKEINFQKHVIPKKFDITEYHQMPYKSKLHQDQYYCSNSCKLLITNPSPCSPCHSHEFKFIYDENRKKVNLLEPAELHAPLKNTSQQKVSLALQQKRLYCKQLESELNDMKVALEMQSKEVTPEHSTSCEFYQLASVCIRLCEIGHESYCCI